MNFNKPLFWHQGLFLQPQHFQYQSQFQQQETYKWFNLQNGYAWGAASLQFDPQALGQGKVELRKLDVVFEDGTLGSFPENMQLGARSFDSHWLDRTKPLNVYLALAKLNASQNNVTQVTSYDNDQLVNTRFVSLVEGEEVSDLHQGGGQNVAIKSMKYAAKLIFESELDDYSNYLVQPVACLESSDEEVRFNSNFVPPSITIKASPVLMDLIKEIRDELVGRSKQLENYKSTTISRTAEFNPVAERYRSALRVIARYAPLLNHYLENATTQPFEVFGQLRALVGELTTFSDEFSILGESIDGTSSAIKYNHRDLFGCFEQCKSLIVSLLDKLTVSPELLVKLNNESGTFVGKLPTEFFARQNSMYLVLETNMPTSDFISSFLTYAKLGSKEQVEQFVQRAIPGVSFEHFDEQPTGLERRPKVTYFVLDRNSPQWKAVEEQGLFSMHWDDAPDDLTVEMVLVRG